MLKRREALEAFSYRIQSRVFDFIAPNKFIFFSISKIIFFKSFMKNFNVLIRIDKIFLCSKLQFLFEISKENFFRSFKRKNLLILPLEFFGHFFLIKKNSLKKKFSYESKFKEIAVKEASF